MRWRWLILLAGLVTLLVWHAALAYWQMAIGLGYERCLPGAAGCPPPAGRGMVFWRTLFM